MSKISLIIQREYNERVRKRSFLLTTILMPLFMVALMVVPTLIMTYSDGANKREIVVIDQSGKIAPRLESHDKTIFSTTKETYPEVQTTKPDAYGYLVVGEDIIENPASLKLYTHESSTIGVESDITRQVSSIIEDQRIAQTNIDGLDSIIQTVKAKAKLTTFTIDQASTDGSTQSSSMVAMGTAYIGGFLIYLFIILYGVSVMNGVIEEKSNRIIEVMISSVKPFELMFGKIVGIALVALTQLAVWIVIFVGVFLAVQSLFIPDMAAGMPTELATIDPDLSTVITTLSNVSYVLTILGCYLIYFVGGYLLYAAMYAAVGSAVDNVQDAQQLQLPVTIPLIFAFILAMNAMNDPNSTLAFWGSMIPFTSPIVMMARVPYGVPAWELIVSIVLLIATFIAMTWFSAKIYRVGIFMYGKKPTLREFIRWIKY